MAGFIKVGSSSGRSLTNRGLESAGGSGSAGSVTGLPPVPEPPAAGVLSGNIEITHPLIEPSQTATSIAVDWGYGGSDTALNAASPFLVSLPLFDFSDQVLGLPGVSGEYASTPDSASLEIVADLEVVVWVALQDWVPAANVVFAAQWDDVAGKSWAFGVDSSGYLRLDYSLDGSAGLSETSTADATGFTYAGWVRVTRDSSTGDINFYTAESDRVVPSSWTQIGSTATGTSGALYNGTASLTIGAMQDDGSERFAAMAVGRVQVYDGTDLAFDADFTSPDLFPPFTATGQDYSGNAGVVTINSGASGCIAMVTSRSCWLTGTSQYLRFPSRREYEANPDKAFYVGVWTSASGSEMAAMGEKSSTSTKGLSIGVTAAGLPVARLHDGGVDKTLTGTTALTLDAPHVIGVDAPGGGTARIWLDGVDEATIGAPGPIVSTTDLGVGAINGSGGTHWDGAILWAAVFGRVLTLSEAEELTAWSGELSTEPLWLRDAATLYVNADDMLGALDYQSNNVPQQLRGSTLLAAGHELNDGDRIRFSSLTGGSALATNIDYFIVNSDTDTFQIALTSGGPGIDVGSDLTEGIFGRTLADDIDHLIVHIGVAPGFTPSQSTAVGTIPVFQSGVKTPVFRVPVEDSEDRYVKVVAVSATGRESGGSDDSVVVNVVGAGDIYGNWDGAIPASLGSSPDPDATRGYALDSSAGSAQYMGNLWVYGNFQAKHAVMFGNLWVFGDIIVG